MALHTLGSNANNSLSALTFEPASVLSPADLAAIGNSIVGDGEFAATNPKGILATGSTHSSTTLDTLVHTAGGPLASIQVGALALGVGIPPGTFVVQILSPSSVLLSQAATASAAGVRIGFIQPTRGYNKLSFEGRLEIPGGRGTLLVKPGDVIGLDNTGWPILLSAATLAYPGSLWTFT